MWKIIHVAEWSLYDQYNIIYDQLLSFAWRRESSTSLRQNKLDRSSSSRIKNETASDNTGSGYSLRDLRVFKGIWFQRQKHGHVPNTRLLFVWWHRSLPRSQQVPTDTRRLIPDFSGRAISAMSSWNIGIDDVSEETQALKNRLSSKGPLSIM